MEKLFMITLSEVISRCKTKGIPEAWLRSYVCGRIWKVLQLIVQVCHLSAPGRGKQMRSLKASLRKEINTLLLLVLNGWCC